MDVQLAIYIQASKQLTLVEKNATMEKKCN
jgi:hypothetical protein